MGRGKFFFILLLFSGFAVCGVDARDLTTTSTTVDSPSKTSRPNEATSFGHNLTASAHLLPDKVCSIGLQAIACGILPTFTLGTSPWLYSDYNMASLIGRWQVGRQGSSRNNLQFAYFNTFNSGRQYDGYDSSGNYYHFPYYQMEAAWLTWIHYERVNSHFDFTTNVGAQYYWNLTRPFSLRRPDRQLNPWQLTFSTLSEAQLVGPIYLSAEVGFIYPLEANPYLHTGATLQLRSEHVLVGLGYSLTSTFRALASPIGRRDCQQAIMGYGQTYQDRKDPDCYDADYAIHPEFTAQVQF